MEAKTQKHWCDGLSLPHRASPHVEARDYNLEAKDDFVFGVEAVVYIKHKYDWIMPWIHNEFWPCRENLLGLTQGEIWL